MADFPSDAQIMSLEVLRFINTATTSRPSERKKTKEWVETQLSFYSGSDLLGHQSIAKFYESVLVFLSTTISIDGY